MVSPMQTAEDKDMEPVIVTAASRSSTPRVEVAAGIPTTTAVVVTATGSSAALNSSNPSERQLDAPGRTGRGPAVTIAPATPSDPPREQQTVRTRLPFRDSRQEDYFRAGEAEREAQRVMIAAQRETIRAGDSVIDALRQQVRGLQQRLDHTASINNSLRMQQYELLRAEEGHSRRTSPSTVQGRWTATFPAVIDEQAHRAYTGSAQTGSSSSTSALARHLGVSHSTTSTAITPWLQHPATTRSISRSEEAERARIRRDQLVREAMDVRRTLLEQRENAAAQDAEAERAAANLRRRRRMRTTSSGMGIDAPDDDEEPIDWDQERGDAGAESEDSDIFADMPPLEALDDGSSPPTSPRPASAQLPARPSDFATSIPPFRWDEQRRAGGPTAPVPGAAALPHTRAGQTAALERLRADPHFRTRVQEYMQPETARRILEVLDSRGTNNNERPTSSAGQAAVPEAAWDEDKAYWQRSKGHVDADGDRVGPATASNTLAETRKSRRMANIDVGR